MKLNIYEVKKRKRKRKKKEKGDIVGIIVVFC
jgi:hypothetical protein